MEKNRQETPRLLFLKNNWLLQCFHITVGMGGQRRPVNKYQVLDKIKNGLQIQSLQGLQSPHIYKIRIYQKDK